jgi:peptide/nickel transport system substrate-binding protein
MAAGLPGERAEGLIEGFLQRGESATPAPGVLSEWLTFLVADIRGYTRFTHDRGDEAAAKLTAKFAQLVRDLVGVFGGTVFELRGDEALCLFGSPRQCLRAAVALQQRFVEETVAQPELPMTIGIGIDAGEAVHGADGYRGGALNLAARLCGLAGAGQVLASPEVTHLARTIEGIRYLASDEVVLKGLTEPIRPVRVVPEGEDPAQQIAALVATATPSMTAAPPGVSPQVPGRRQLRRRWVVLAAVLVLAAGAVTGVVLTRRGADTGITPRLFANVVNVFDLSGRLRSQIPVGKNPSSIAAAGNSLWVTNQDDGTASHINLATDQVTPITNVGDAPAGVAVGGGSAWVVSPTNAKNADPAAGSVTPVNPDTNVATDPLGSGHLASGVAYGAGHLWVAATEDAQVYRFDPANPAILKRFDVGTAPTGIAATKHAIWVTNAGDNTVSELDPNNGRPLHDPIPVGLDPVAVAVGRSGVWVADHLGETITRIDPTTYATYPIRVGDGPSGVVVTDNAVWVTTEYAGQLVRIDPATRQVTATPSVSGAPRSIAAAGDRLFVASATSYRGHEGGTLRMRIGGFTPGGPYPYPVTDPNFSGDFTTELLQTLTTDTLVAYSRAPGPAGDSLVPDLAVSLPHVGADTTHYLFRLWPNIKFSTSQTLRAHDVRTSVERALIENASDLKRTPLSAILGAAACFTKHATSCDLSNGIKIDDTQRTVEFVLGQPEPAFLSWLAFGDMAIVPSSTPIYTFADFKTQHPRVPGTGSYQLSTVEWPRHIVLTPNQYFHQWSRAAQPRGYVQSIVIDQVPSSPQNLIDLEHRKFDVLDDQSLSAADVQQAVSGYPVVTYPEGGSILRLAFLNTRMPPFNSRKARQAINYAVNRETALKERQGGARLTLTCQIIRPGVTGYRPYCPYTLNPGSGTWTAPNLPKAKRLVHESGTYGDDVIVWDYPGTHDPKASYFVKALDDIGYHATLHPPVSLPDYLDAAFHQHTIQIGMLGEGYPNADGGLALGDWMCNSSNPGRYCNPHITHLYHRGLTMEVTNPQGARNMWTRLDKALVDDAAIVPMWTDSTYALVSTRVGNWSIPSGDGILLGQLWVNN